MKTLFRFITLLVLCSLIFTTGITSAAADGPKPVGVPNKNPVVKSSTTSALVTGKPQALLLNKSSVNTAQLEPAIVIGKPQIVFV